MRHRISIMFEESGEKDDKGNPKEGITLVNHRTWVTVGGFTVTHEESIEPTPELTEELKKFVETNRKAMEELALRQTISHVAAIQNTEDPNLKGKKVTRLTLNGSVGAIGTVK